MAALTGAALAAGAAGLGARLPLIFELLGAAALLGLGLLGHARLRRGPPPTRAELLLALLGAEGLALATLIGGRCAGLSPDLVEVCRRLSAAAAVLSGCALGALALLPRLRAWWGPGLEGTDPAGTRERDGASEPATSPPARWARPLIAGLWLLVHAPVLVALPPLTQPDSCTNVMEPDLFQPMSSPLHHTPLYSAAIKTACDAPSVLAGLEVVVALQHAIVLLIALGLESIVRRAGAAPWIAALVGCAAAVDVHLTQYAQSLMTEVVATATLLGAVAALARAEREPAAGAWIAAAGLLAAATTLTRQVAELWFVVGLAWLGCVAAVRPRGRACLVFAATALAPVLLLVAHNWVFHGRAILTAGFGRTFVPRLTLGMPALEDPAAPPGDELERARRVIWSSRGAAWGTVHAAIQAELGWDEARIGSAVRRLWLEQLVRHPGPFARVTLGSVATLLRASERWEGVQLTHDHVTPPTSPADWPVLPSGRPPPAWLAAQDRLAPSTAWPVLLLAALAPLVARGPARRLALLALATVAYVVLIPALLDEPIPRYRIPASPMLLLAAGLGLSGVLDRSLFASASPTARSS